jgi:hypothetical protein
VVGTPEIGSSILDSNILLSPVGAIHEPPCITYLGANGGFDYFVACHPEGTRRPKGLVEILHHFRRRIQNDRCELRSAGVNRLSEFYRGQRGLNIKLTRSLAEQILDIYLFS